MEAQAVILGVTFQTTIKPLALHKEDHDVLYF